MKWTEMIYNSILVLGICWVLVTMIGCIEKSYSILN